MRILATPVVLLLAACAAVSAPAAAPTPLQREISELARSMEETHPDLFHDVSRARLPRRRREACRRRAGADAGRARGAADARWSRCPVRATGTPAIYPVRRAPESAARSIRSGSTTSPTACTPSRSSRRPRPDREAADLDRRSAGRRGRRLVRPLVPHDNESSRRWLLPEYLDDRGGPARASGSRQRTRSTFGFADGERGRRSSRDRRTRSPPRSAARSRRCPGAAIRSGCATSTRTSG